MIHVLNWVGQGMVIALATQVVLRILSRSRAQARYGLCWIALAAVVALPMAGAGALAGARPPAVAVAVEPVAGTVSLPPEWWTSPALPLGLWTLWMAVAAVRVTRAALSVRRARAAARPFPAEVENRLRCWTSLGRRGRRARLVLSCDVRTAAVLGVGDPAIAVAPALLAHLDDQDLDRIVVHEWAHVQRRDDLLNVAHVIVKTVAGWHPAVWMLERQLRVEREVACDEMSVAVTGCRKTYATSLTIVAGLSPLRAPVSALGAVASPGLKARVLRILSQERLLSPAISASAAGLAAVAVAAVGLAITEVRLIAAPVPPPAIAGGAPRSDSGAEAIVQPSASLAATRRRVAESPVPAQHDTGLTAERRSAPGAAAVATASQAIAPASQPEPVPRPSPDAFGPVPAIERPVRTTVTLALPAGPVTDAKSPITGSAPTPWAVAADTGVAVGRGSRTAAVATAGFFTRFGKKIAGSF